MRRLRDLSLLVVALQTRSQPFFTHRAQVSANKTPALRTDDMIVGFPDMSRCSLLGVLHSVGESSRQKRECLAVFLPAIPAPADTIFYNVAFNHRMSWSTTPDLA